MPMLKLTMSGPTVPWTKMPNYLIDHQMPKLRDTELRVLLVVVRYTIGYHLPRENVFLTYDFLMKRTGRRSEAIAHAVTNLERRGLIRRTLELSTEQRPTDTQRFGIHPGKSEDYKQKKAS